MTTTNHTELGVDQLVPGAYQPRSDFNRARLEELAETIKAHGIIQNIVVRPLQNSRQYEILAGERRWRAAQLAGLHDVPVSIRYDIDDQTALKISLIENVQREALSPIEEARALKRLCDEFSMTHDEVGDAVGRSREAVTNLVRFLDLEPELQEHIHSNRISLSQAKILCGVDPQVRKFLMNEAVNKKLTVKELQARVDNWQRGNKRQHVDAKEPNVAYLEQQLSEGLGCKVRIQTKKEGSGVLSLYFHSADEFEGILGHIHYKT